MLVSKNIPFQHHDLLTVQMLEDLRDSSLNAAILPYIHYADGIVHGLAVSMNDKQLYVEPGAIKKEGFLYMMMQPLTLQLNDEQCQGVVVARKQQQHWAIEVVEAQQETDVVLTVFQKRDRGSKLHVIDDLKKVTFINYFQAQHIRVAGSDGQLTYCSVIAQCFANALLQKPGATMLDTTFAWQALQHTPTKTMWVLYLNKNDAVWTDDGNAFVQQLQAILSRKNEPLMHVIAHSTGSSASKPVAQTEFNSIIVD